MKITLKDVDNTLELSDDQFDVPGWISFHIQEGQEIELHIKDILPALIAFDVKYSSKEKEV